jgi:L-iditol 2-dehydrogenase
MISDLPETMQAAVLVGPERIDVLELPVPVPRLGEVLLRIEAATTCGTDVKVFKGGGHPRMLKTPTVFGHEMAGYIAAIGPEASSVSVGERVVVANSAPCLVCDYCRRGRENLCEDLQYLNGAFAEYLLIPPRFVRRSVYRLPEHLSFAKAALAEPLACVLHGIEACELPTRGRQDILVLGGGPIGLLFVAVLARDGHAVTLADPNAARLEAGHTFGAADTIEIARGGGQGAVLRARSPAAKGFGIVVDATGVPAVWLDAIESTRPGGLVNLFGGCPPGTTISLDTHLVHYSEITLKGVYHHRPQTFRRAVDLLADSRFAADRLLSAKRPIAQTTEALLSMIYRDTLKVVIAGRGA